MQEYFEIQKDVLLLKNTLCDIKSKISTNTLIFNSVDDLTRDIDFYSVSMNDRLLRNFQLLTNLNIFYSIRVSKCNLFKYLPPII